MNFDVDSFLSDKSPERIAKLANHDQILGLFGIIEALSIRLKQAGAGAEIRDGLVDYAKLVEETDKLEGLAKHARSQLAKVNRELQAATDKLKDAQAVIGRADAMQEDSQLVTRHTLRKELFAALDDHQRAHLYDKE